MDHQKVGDFEQKSLINELTQGKELATQLQAHLNVASSSQETHEVLVQKILSSYEKALSMLTSGTTSVTGLCESPPSLNESPRSEDSDPELRHDASRKRKNMPRWTQQVRVSPGMGLEGPLDDGFCWRKYGQKDILGAKYPRGYYRCTHRNVQGCLATKQVQRSDEDPTIFEVTYRGRHTCAQSSHLINPQSHLSDQNQELPTNATTTNIPNPPPPPPPLPQQQQYDQKLLLNFRSDLKVVTSEQPYDLFKFPSSSNVNHGYQGSVFPQSVVESGLMGNFSPPFGSPSPSGNNYFSANSSSFGGNRNIIQSGDQYDNNHAVSAAKSATISATVGLEFPFGNMDFDPNFSFDNRGFLH